MAATTRRFSCSSVKSARDVATVLDRDTVTLAAPFDSGDDFLSLLGLSGGMPTLVSIPKSSMIDALKASASASDDLLQAFIGAKVGDVFHGQTVGVFHCKDARLRCRFVTHSTG